MNKVGLRKEKSFVRSLSLGAVLMLVMVVYAYGFNVTKVNFETTRSEKRLTQLTRILRALAHPNLFEYEKEELVVTVPVYLPCPKSGLPALDQDHSQPYIILTPACGGAKEIIQVEGFGFWTDVKGPINFIPPSGATLNIGNLTTDSGGYFSARVQLPNRKPVDDAQTIRAIARRNIGTPNFSQVAYSTWEKIVETVFLALLATTLGTFLAIPVSFLAARNLMSTRTNQLTSAALSILGWPLGILIGLQIMRWIRAVVSQFVDRSSIVEGTFGLLSGLLITGVLMRWSLTWQETRKLGMGTRLAQIVTIIAAGVATLFTIHIVSSSFAVSVGTALIEPLGELGFLGNFIVQLGDVVSMVTPLVVYLVCGGFISHFGGRLGQYVSDHMSANLVRLANLIATSLAGACVLSILGALVDWFYQIDDLQTTLWWPAGVGAALGLLLSARASPKDLLPVGSVGYYVTRTILNATRSI